MKFEEIEFKNIFAYGENVQKVEYSSDGKLVLLRGQSGAGKSAILSLPILLLYGKTKVNKAGIANRVNKHGWIKGTIWKGQHRYTIERGFAPNFVKVWKDDIEVDVPGTAGAEAYIENEIQEIPLNTFTNMVTISMKKFKSFLTMSPAERKAVVDEVFDVSIINAIAEQIKKDMRDLGNSINGDESSIFSLTQNLTEANAELVKIQEKNASSDSREKIEENNKLILQLNDLMKQNADNMAIYSQRGQEQYTLYNSKQAEVMKFQQNNRTIDEKIRLFSQSKCPTCSTPFVGASFDELKQKLQEFKNQTIESLTNAQNELQEIQNTYNQIVEENQKLQNQTQQIRLQINNLQNENALLTERMKASAEYTAVVNIIEKVSKQIDEIKVQRDAKQKDYTELQRLVTVYSIDGVTKLIINNYLPLLNSDIAENLILLNFPYTLEFDEKFNPHLKDMAQEVQVETLSDGEQTRVDLVVLCSLFKLLKRKYPSINILTIDESISTLDPMNSGAVLAMLTDFAMEHDLNCFIVSHTDLFMDNFQEMIEVEKVNGFSQLTKTEL